MNFFAIISANVPQREIGFLADAGLSLMMREVAAILGSLLLVVGVIVLWAVYFRPKGRRRRHHHHRQSTSAGPAPAGSPQGRQRIPEGERRRRRRSRHEERPLNPTLAQSGGLPPMRDEETPPRGL